MTARPEMAALIRRSRAASGVPERVEDLTTAEQVAAIFARDET